MLVASPYLPQYLERWPSYDLWLKSLQQHIGSDLKVHDYSQLLTHVSDFADAIHINKQGSLKLLNAMISDGVLTPSAARTTLK